MDRIKAFFRNNELIFLAFFIPVILTTIGFAITGIYPFGEQQIAVIDMYHQYQPFLGELQNRLQSGGSLFYSWDGAAGGNFWNLLAYYGASPLNLLLILFPKALVGEAIAFILLIRIGLAGSFMAIYLRSLNNKINMGTVAFSTCYALCSFVMGYYWCIMWIDAVVLLPLIMLGMTRIIQEKGCVLYTVALAIVVFSNYYIAIMVCIFIAFYYPVMYFTLRRWAGVRECVYVTCRAVFFSLLAIAMAAVMLYPTYLSMQYTYYISSDFPTTLTFYNKAMEIINQLLPYTQLTYREGLPNIYSGLIVVIMGVFYVLDKTIELKEKALNMGFLAFIFLSLNINILNYIWHGFHFPNQLPYRYTFVVSFVLITMAYKAFIRIDQVKVNAIWGAMAGILGWMVISQNLLAEKITNDDVYLYGGVTFLLIYTAALVLYRKRMIAYRAFVIMLALFVFAELGVNVTQSFKEVGNTSRDVYYENYDDIEHLTEKVDEEMVRVEMDDNYILNCPAFYHYKGISEFSSSINADATAIMEKIGVEGEPGKNRYNYNQTSPVTNAFLNVKYLISKNKVIYDPDFDEVAESGDSILYQSKYPLSLGYMVGDEIWTWQTSSENPFEVLEDYVRAATGNKYTGVFKTVEPVYVDSEGLDLLEDGDGMWEEELLTNGTEGTAEFTYRADATQKYYVFIEADCADEIWICKNDEVDDIEIRDDCGSVVNAGVINEDDEFTVRVKYKEDQCGFVTCHVRTLNQDVWDKAYNEISKSMWDITSFGDSYVKGSVTAMKDGVFVTSIPYENGWSLKVDGVKKEINQLMGDAFIATPLSAGTHDIELKFRPPGIIAGAIISLLAVLILLTCSCFGQSFSARILKRSAILPQETEEPEESEEEESDYNTEEIDYCPEEE